jgi:predicted small lipoprotein YifL
MSGRVARGWIAAAGVLLVCAGCGFKGRLYLPERNATVVTHPAQAAQGAPSAGQTQTPAAKSKRKTSQPSGSPPTSSPQSPPPPSPP